MTVIYLFVSPSGRTYAGRHTCQHEGWPPRGSGALPSGYRGSGKLWANVTRRHGPAIRWIILRRFGPDAARADIDAAERRAIRLVRAMWGERCANVLEGGEGFTSADAQALWADPNFAAKNLAATAQALSSPEVKARQHRAIREALNRPEVKARQSAAQLEAQNRPEVKAKLSNSLKEAHARPEVKAKHKASLAAAMARPGVREACTAGCNRPEVRARNSVTHKALAQTPERRAFLASIQASSNTPEAKAKAAATRARNKALKAMETQQ